MLANPDGADAALLGLLSDETQQLRRGERIGGRYPEIDAHERSLVVGRMRRAAVSSVGLSASPQPAIFGPHRSQLRENASSARLCRRSAIGLCRRSCRR